ncbi:hypothetical protein [Flavivirga aquatica]|nr:hypothetical protein [Flavivirga aquatica]
MKFILSYVLFLIAITNINAQFNFTINGSFKDILSQRAYTKINTENGVVGAEAVISLLSTKSFTSLINDQLEELLTFNDVLLREKENLINFVKGGSFSKGLGYNSYGYITKKYPLFDLNPSDVFRKKIIRYRFELKLKKESKKIRDYLNVDNPIPEGERILLTLTTLENVINLTLENESY